MTQGSELHPYCWPEASAFTRTMRRIGEYLGLVEEHTWRVLTDDEMVAVLGGEPFRPASSRTSRGSSCRSTTASSCAPSSPSSRPRRRDQPRCGARRVRVSPNAGHVR